MRAALQPLLLDDDHEVRAGTAYVLAVFGGDIDDTSWLLVANDEGGTIGLHYLERLAESGRRSIPALTELLGSDNEEARRVAVSQLAACGRQAAAALPDIRAYESHADGRISASAQLAIAHIEYALDH